MVVFDPQDFQETHYDLWASNIYYPGTPFEENLIRYNLKILTALPAHRGTDSINTPLMILASPLMVLI